MRLLVLCLCVLHLAYGSSGLKSPKGPQVSCNLSQSKESVSHGRMRPLFARRGQYEQQKIHVAKPSVLPGPENHIPRAKVAPKPAKPAKPNCSESGQSCFPQSGCCDLCATCHCRFFNAICFCRKTNSQCERKRPSGRRAKQKRRHTPAIR